MYIEYLHEGNSPCGYCLEGIHCVTASTGISRLIFGKITKLTVESSEYQFNNSKGKMTNRFETNGDT